MKKEYNYIFNLNERAKELKCLYTVEKHLKDFYSENMIVFKKIADDIPYGWQYPLITKCKITYEGNSVMTDGFKLTEWCIKSDIIINNKVQGNIVLCYTEPVDHYNKDPFLKEEHDLLEAISDRLSNYIFNKEFKHAYEEWDKTLKILDALNDKEAKALRILMNSDPDEALEYFKAPSVDISSSEELQTILSERSQKHWKWRMSMAKVVAEKTDMGRFGIKGIWVFGSTVKATSGPKSDIDFIVHYDGNEQNKNDYTLWCEGWSLALAELNYYKTGHKTDVLLDLHFITDKDIEEKTVFASMLNDIYNIKKLK
jgi:predicted nucleotidyltransferase